MTEPDWRGRESNPNGKLYIGKNTIVREGTIINKPTELETRIGNNCYIMSQCFIGHDSVIGDGCQLAPGAKLAGFVSIGANTHIGINASVHQRSRIGSYCVLGGGSFFKGTSPDGIVWGGVPARPLKVNMIGIDRSSLPDDEKNLLIERAKLFIDDFKSSRDI